MTGEQTVHGPDAARARVSAESWMALGVFVLGALCYLNALRGEFVFDDIKLIVNNDIIKDPRNASQIFFTNLWGLLGRDSNYYRPLPPLVFMLLHALFGLQPEPFHVVSVALHAATTSLVFLTARALLDAAGTRPVQARWAAFAGAAVFAVHPVHSEAVAWISGVMDLSCAFFSLLALYLYVTADSSGRRLPRELVSLGALLLGLFSKEPAAVVPFVVVAYDLMFGPRRVARLADALRRWGPPFAVLVAYLALRGYVLGGVAPFSRAEPPSSLDVVLMVPRLFALYLQVLVVPVGLNVLHDIEPVTALTSPALMWSFVIIGAFGALSWLALRAGRVAAFGLVLFLLPLAPALYVPALGQEMSLLFAERYLYLPSVGAAVLLSACLATLGSRSQQVQVGLSATVIVVVGLFAGMTISRNSVWKDGVALWTDCVQKSPGLGIAHEGLGLALLRRGQASEGTRALQVALRLEPDLAQRSLNNGLGAARSGLMLQAVLSFQTAIIYKPDFVDAHYNLGIAFEHLGWSMAAMQEYRATLARDAGHVDAHNNLGVLLAQQGRLDEAIDHFTAAARSRPSDPELHLNLARAYDARGVPKKAEEHRALAALAGTAPAK